MPTISQYTKVDVELDISTQEFFDECSDDEKKELMKLAGAEYGYGYVENEVALQYFRNEFDLKKLFKAIGIDQAEKALSEAKGN